MSVDRKMTWDELAEDNETLRGQLAEQDARGLRLAEESERLRDQNDWHNRTEAENEKLRKRVDMEVALADRQTAEVERLREDLKNTNAAYDTAVYGHGQCEAAWRSKVERLRDENAEAAKWWQHRAEVAEAENERLRAGLRWYGDVENYVARQENAYGQPDPMLKPVTRASRDAGKRARNALAEGLIS